MYRVLLVDDEPFIVEGLQDAVDWSAYDLEVTGTAGNGRAALELLKQSPVDLLVTDINMPAMTGLELIREARAMLPDLKVIILSGYNDFDYVKQGLTLGIENYLLKPVNFKELRSTLATVADKLNAEEETPFSLSLEERDILKDRILYRWMRGEIAPAELNQRAELLGLRLNLPWLTAAAVRGQGERYGALRAQILSLLPPEASSLCFTDLDGDVVLLFLSETPEQGRAAARETLETLSHSGLLRLSLGTAERIGEVEQRSYALAKKAQDYHLLNSGSSILDAEELQELRGGINQSLDIGGDDYSRMLLARDTERLYDRIDEDFQRFQGLEGATPEFLQSAAIELVVAFRLELRDMRGGEQSQEVLFQFKKTLDRIGRASSLKELTDAVKASAHFTMELLQRNDRVPVVNQVIQHVAQHYQEALSLKTLGARYHIHPAYLGQLFSKETGAGFTEYLNKYRIERAKALLKETDDKVADISREAGYVESGYFYKQFKKYVGISPNEYRELR